MIFDLYLEVCVAAKTTRSNVCFEGCGSVGFCLKF